MSHRLPPRPSLAQLKHQAKDLLKAHARRDPACCATLRLLPRLAQIPDAQLLSASLTLLEAQHALALSYGFETWRRLRERVEQTAPPTRERPPARWFHGSTAAFETLRPGSTVTPILELARAFSHAPSTVSINVREDDERNVREITIEHNGMRAGHVYEVEVSDPSDLTPHAESRMAPGEEMLTARPLPVRLMGSGTPEADRVQRFQEQRRVNP